MLSKIYSGKLVGLIGQVCGRVREICEKEKVTITDDGVSALADVGRGDMRKTLNILQVPMPCNTPRHIQSSEQTDRSNCIFQRGNILEKLTPEHADMAMQPNVLTARS